MLLGREGCEMKEWEREERLTPVRIVVFDIDQISSPVLRTPRNAAIEAAGKSGRRRGRDEAVGRAPRCASLRRGGRGSWS